MLAQIIIKNYNTSQVDKIVSDKDCAYFIYFNLHDKIRNIYFQIIINNLEENVCQQLLNLGFQQLAIYLKYTPEIQMLCHNEVRSAVELLIGIKLISKNQQYIGQGYEQKYHINMHFLSAIMTKNSKEIIDVDKITTEKYNFLRQISYQSIMQCQKSEIVKNLYIKYDVSMPYKNLRQVIVFIGKNTRQKLLVIFEQILKMELALCKQERPKIFINLIKLIKLSPTKKFPYDNMNNLMKRIIQYFIGLRLADLDGDKFVISDYLHQFPIRQYHDISYDFHLVIEPNFKAYLHSTTHQISTFYSILLSHFINYQKFYLKNFVPGQITEQKLKNMLKIGLKADEILKFLSKFIKLKPKKLKIPEKYKKIQFLRWSEFEGEIPSLICNNLRSLQAQEECQAKGKKSVQRSKKKK